MKIRSCCLQKITKNQREVYSSYIAHTDIFQTATFELFFEGADTGTTDLSSFSLSGTKFHILGPRFDLLSEP